MDPLDQVPAGLDGITCAVCDGSVPESAIEVLARRDALAFVQVGCGACGSTTLAFVLAASDRASSAAAEPSLTVDDVLDMHVFLRGWQGGIAELLRPQSPGSGPR